MLHGLDDSLHHKTGTLLLRCTLYLPPPPLQRMQGLSTTSYFFINYLYFILQ